MNVKCLLTYGRVWGFVQLFRSCADILMNNYLSIPKILHLLLEVGSIVYRLVILSGFSHGENFARGLKRAIYEEINYTLINAAQTFVDYL